MTEEKGDEASAAEAESETAAETEPETEAEPAVEPDEAAKAAKPLPGAGTPAGETLARAVAAFEAGDYRAVRELTGQLVEAPDDEVARAARELRARTQIDPVQVGVVLACLALFAVIVYVYVLP